MRIKKIWIVLICLAFMMCACSKKETPEITKDATGSTSIVMTESSVTEAASSGEMMDLKSDGTSVAPRETISPMTTSISKDEDVSFSSTEETSPLPAVDATVTITIDPIVPANSNTPSGQLTAGEWNDLKNWDFWQDLMNTQEWSGYASTWGLASQTRTAVIITSNQQALAGIDVVLRDNQDNEIWSAETDIYGTAYLFDAGRNDANEIEISYLGQTLKTLDYEPIGKEIKIDFDDLETINSQSADILFMIDTTGSMSDELSYLQTELTNVIASVTEQNTALDIALSANYYRDEGDDYVIKSFPFTDSYDLVKHQMLEQFADGGGDFPEAVDVALMNAVFEHNWNQNAQAKLVFLVLDAPPHNNQKVMSSLQKTIQAAAKNGIKIIPIASSGIDKETEYVLRSLAIETNGTYTFLTDDSGVGNGHLEPTIGSYEVEHLNDLLVRLIHYYTKG